MEPGQQNILRLGELCSQTGDKAGAAAAFLKLAEMTEASGANAAQWFERAYAEDPADIQIALGYGKSLIAQGQVGAAIFVLEPLAKAKDATPGNARNLRQGFALRKSPDATRSRWSGSCFNRTRPASRMLSI